MIFKKVGERKSIFIHSILFFYTVLLFIFHFDFCRGVGLGFGCSSDGLVCPDPQNLGCICTPAHIHCLGPSVTQEGIQEAVDKVREINGLEHDQWLYRSQISISLTNLTRLDLTPFLRTWTTNFHIENNPHLTLIKMKGPPSNLFIRTENLTIALNQQLTNEGVGQTLKYFSRRSLKRLYLYDNNLHESSESSSSSSSWFPGSGSDPEFLPGLGHMTRLTHLVLSKNNISRLSKGQFQRNTRLESLILFHTGLEEIEEGAFHFDYEHGRGSHSHPYSHQLAQSNPNPSPNEDGIGIGMTSIVTPLTLQIDLSGNFLTEDGLSENTGLDQIRRNVYLDLSDNQFESLPWRIFHPFLQVRKENQINIEENPLNCDGNLTWIIKYDFENQVHGGFCANDPNSTIFNSTFVDSGSTSKFFISNSMCNFYHFFLFFLCIYAVSIF